MNIDEVINGWTFEETIKTAESLMEVEKNMFKWDVIRHLRDFAETYREQLKDYQQLEEQDRLVICGECKYNKYSTTEKEFYCSNTDSDNYGIATMYDDSCEDFEEKGD